MSRVTPPRKHVRLQHTSHGTVCATVTIRTVELGPYLGLHCSGHVADISRRDGECWSTLGLRASRKLDMSYACLAQQRQLRSLWLGRVVGAALRFAAVMQINRCGYNTCTALQVRKLATRRLPRRIHRR